MAYEYRSRHGLIRLICIGRAWKVELDGIRAGRWRSAQAAASAIIQRSSGLRQLDGHDDVDAPGDLVRWTPLADNL